MLASKDTSAGDVFAWSSDWVNVVTDYGADPTGVSSSQSAFESAIASGKNVYIPALEGSGLYVITDTLIPDTLGQMIVGSSWGAGLGAQRGKISFQNTTDDLFAPTKGTVFYGFRVLRSGAFDNPTGGAYFNLGSSASRSTVQSILMTRPYYGVQVGNNFACVLRDLDIQATKKYGLYLRVDSPFGACIYDDIRIVAKHASAGSDVAGIYQDGGDYNQFNLITTGALDYGIQIESLSGSTHGGIFTNTVNDNIQVHGISITKPGIHDNFGAEFSIIHQNMVNGGGIYVGEDCEASFSQITQSGVGGHGAEIHGNNAFIQDLRNLPHAVNNTFDGIHLGATANDTTIVGGRVYNKRYGVNTISGSTNTSILGFNGTGNTTAPFNLNGTSEKVRGCQGIADVG